MSEFEHLTQLLDQVEALTDSSALEGFDLGKEAAELAKVQEKPHEFARAMLRIGWAGRHLGRLREAMDALQIALPILEAFRDTRRYMQALNILGIIYGDLSDSHSALQYFEKAAQEARILGDQLYLLRVLNNVAGTFMDMGDYVRSLEQYEKLLAIYKEYPNPHEESYILNNIGYAHLLLAQAESDEQRQRQHLHQALVCTEHSIELCQQLHLVGNLCESQSTLAITLMQLKRYDEAKESLLTLLALSKEVSHKRHEGIALTELGKLYSYLNDFLVSDNYFLSAIDVLETSQIQGELHAAHLSFSESLETQGRFEEALRHFKRYHQLDQHIRSEDATAQLEVMSARLDLERAQHEGELQRLRNQELAALNAKLEEQSKAFQHLANHDPLTQLANRRSLEVQLDRLFAKAQKEGHIFTVVLLDIDHFKRINDRFSHHIGDEVLKHIAKILQHHTRTSDFCARYGGEEFVLIADKLQGRGAWEYCERLRRAVELYPWAQIHIDLRVTLSLGFCYDTTLENHERMLSVADEYLYVSKESGRNCVSPPLAELPKPV